jgi:hypothetical protein
MVPFPTNTNNSDYMKVLTIYSNQQNQAALNLKTHDEYVSRYDSWIKANTNLRDQGLPLQPVLVLPKKVTFEDDGGITYTPFDDLKVTALPPLNTSPSTGPVATTGIPVDRLDTVLMLLQELLRRIPPKV